MKVITGFEEAKAVILQRTVGLVATSEQEAAVRQIIDEVCRHGDRALFEFTEKFDRVRLAALEVTGREIDEAFRRVEPALIRALELAAARITAFHQRQRRLLLRDSSAPLGWQFRPLARVGIHVPGFGAPLPSSLLMTAIPARVAGVGEIIVVTPPTASGEVATVTLAAARLAGIDRIFAIGGAQAVAALAFGTESIPRVDKVCGPGNIYVSLAKKMVFGSVGIDGLYGPSEVVIIADGSARPEYIAADMLAQAEHSTASAAVLLTDSAGLALAVQSELARQLEGLPRREVTSASLKDNGMIITVESIDQALELANLYAPEHLCLFVKDAPAYVARVRNAGCIFVGEGAVEVLVDYVAGPSHVLPTQGAARFSSGLSVLDFVKLIPVVRPGKKAARRLSRAASVIARAEGLDAHAASAEKRLKGRE